MQTYLVLSSSMQQIQYVLYLFLCYCFYLRKSSAKSKISQVTKRESLLYLTNFFIVEYYTWFKKY